MNQFTGFRARSVVPVTQPAISDGMIVCNDHRIVEVGRFSKVARKFPGLNSVDLGDVAILPGLINAHTHLEFNDLETPLGTPGISLVDWIALVMNHRKSASLDSVEQRIQSGLLELIDGQTAAVGEIATSSFIPNQIVHESISEQKLQTFAPKIVSFYELIGSSPQRIEAAKSNASSHLEKGGDPDSLQTALSPHAPYSCDEELVRWACERSRKRKFPVAMHLAESKEELELLYQQTGPFRELLESMNVWNPAAFSKSRTPLDYLEVLSTAARSLVVHGNYLSKAEIQYIADHRQEMSVVYCPRTHAFFGHEQYPLETMLDARVNVALGTDSRASNPDLSVWKEARFVAKSFPTISPSRILEMVTIDGARALGLEQEFGSIDAGKRVALKVVQCGEMNEKELLESLLQD